MSQHMDALKKAQQVRLAGARLKEEVAAGTITATTALDDERAGSLRVVQLLGAQRGWARAKVRKASIALSLSDTIRVRDLTDRQRKAIRIFLAAMGGERPPRAVSQREKAGVLSALLRGAATRAELTVRLDDDGVVVYDLDAVLAELQRQRAVTWKKVDGFLLYSVTDWTELAA